MGAADTADKVLNPIDRVYQPIKGKFEEADALDKLGKTYEAEIVRRGGFLDTVGVATAVAGLLAWRNQLVHPSPDLQREPAQPRLLSLEAVHAQLRLKGQMEYLHYNQHRQTSHGLEGLNPLLACGLAQGHLTDS
jgi:hypothetical protein